MSEQKFKIGDVVRTKAYTSNFGEPKMTVAGYYIISDGMKHSDKFNFEYPSVLLACRAFNFITKNFEIYTFHIDELEKA